MAPHSSTLAWKIPWTEEPGRLAVHGITMSRTRLKQRSSSSSKVKGDLYQCKPNSAHKVLTFSDIVRLLSRVGTLGRTFVSMNHK